MACQPQIARVVMIGCHVWITRKEIFAIFENVKSGKDDGDEANTKENPQWQDRFGVRTNHGKERAHQWMICKP
jgi:hypothetical protein